MFIHLSMAFKASSEQVAGCFPHQLPCAQLLCVSDGLLTVSSLPWGQLLPPLDWWLLYHGTFSPLHRPSIFILLPSVFYS